MAGYSSRQSTYTDGDTVTAAHTNNEFDTILAGFNSSTGHNHDGSAGEGARVLITDTTGGTQYGVPLLNGSGQQVTSTAAMTAGQLLVGQSAAVPAPVAVSGDATLAASGALTVASAVLKSVPTDSGTGTPSSSALTIAGGEGIDTSASGATVTIAAEDASATNKGVVELATDAETVTGSDTARATTPANITAKMAAPGTIGGTTPAAGNFTNLDATGTLVVDGNCTLGDASGDAHILNGTVTQPHKPSFLAYNSAEDANATGNNAEATVDFDTEVFDRGSNFATDTFTAPTTGIYRLSAQVTLQDWSATVTSVELKIVTSNRTYSYFNTAGFPTTDVSHSFNLSVLADMDAADTATVTITASGLAGNTLDILGAAAPFTFFCGELVA